MLALKFSEPGWYNQLERDALEEYVENGKSIIKSNSYPGSNMQMIGEFARNPNEFLKKHSLELSIESSFRLDRVFLTLAAPSYEGKTQTAFTLPSVNVLYFNMVAADYETGMRSIFSHFARHSRLLKYVAYLDTEALNFPEQAPSADYLLSEPARKPLYVLGLWLELMQQSAGKAKQPANADLNWMKFYASEMKPFNCKKVPIENFMTHMKALNLPFCLFLDEFLAEKWCHYVRNLALAVGLPCIVANTSIKHLMTLTDQDVAAEEGHCFSLVFRRLDKIDKDNKDLLKIDATMQALKSRCKDYKLASKEFDILFNEALYNCNPGVAFLFAQEAEKLLKDLSRNKSGNSKDLTVESLLKSLAREVAFAFCWCKCGMSSSLNGQVAKLGLLTDVSYSNSAPLDENDNIFHFIQFMNCHLYHLIDPTGKDADYFLTFRPIGRSSSLRIAKDSQFVDWTLPLTAFDSDDLLTRLACACMSMCRSTNSVLLCAVDERMLESCYRFSSKNLIALSGSNFKWSAAVACVEASCHELASTPESGAPFQNFTFRGVNGVDWIRNVISNCDFSEFFDKRCEGFRDEGLNNWLKSLHIPFLYGINNPNAILDALTNNPSTGVFAKNYHLSINDSVIRGSFELLQYDNEGNATPRTCVIECKNLADPQNAITLDDHLESVIEEKELPALFVIFTDKSPSAAEKNSITTTCEKFHLNLFHLNFDRNCRIDINRTLCPILKAPKSVGIIFQVQSVTKI